jgi:hypothetical protein
MSRNVIFQCPVMSNSVGLDTLLGCRLARFRPHGEVTHCARVPWRPGVGDQTRSSRSASQLGSEAVCTHPGSIERVRIFLCQTQEARSMSNTHAACCVRPVGCVQWRQRVSSRAQFQGSVLKLGLLKVDRHPVSRSVSRSRRIQRPPHRYFPAMRGRA